MRSCTATLCLVLLALGCASYPPAIPDGVPSFTVTCPNASYEGASLKFEPEEVVGASATLGRYPKSSVRFRDDQNWLPARLVLRSGSGVFKFALPPRNNGEEFILLTTDKGWPFLLSVQRESRIDPEGYSAWHSPGAIARTAAVRGR